MGRAEFSGNYSHNIDPKGRATIPAAYREALSEGFTIGLNNDFNAIALYPAEKWAEIGRRLDRIPDSDARGMAYVRLIKAFSFTDQALDGQGKGKHNEIYPPVSKESHKQHLPYRANRRL